MQSNVAISDVTTPIVTATVIRGPWPNKEGTAEEVDCQIQPSVKAVKANHVVEALLTIAPMLFNNLEIAGFNGDDVNATDSTLVIEALKSLMMKHHGLYHPLQDVAANLFVTDESGEVTITNRLELDLAPCDDTEVVIHDCDEYDLD